jgi:uncharacterized protein YjiS (DUF1127 family)
MTTAAALTALETMGFGPIRSPFARIVATMKTVRTRQAARRTYAYLLDADPHLLADIGLTRADVQYALRACDRP